MESIGTTGSDLLLNRMQSDRAVSTGAKGKNEPQPEAGNALANFGGMLKQQMADIDALQANADKAVETYATGGDIETHNVILAMDKADMAMQLGLQVRNRALSAYQEIRQMTV